MPLTTVLNAISIAYPDITNRIRASIYVQSSPQAFVASIIDSTAGHPQRIWSFPGLPRNNYGFNLEEIDGSDAIVTNLAHFDVVPGEVDGALNRDDEHIQVGVTIGFVAGANTATFDGTGGAPDYRGWEIVPSQLTGRGILVRDDLDYSWDKTTGVFTLLQPGDILESAAFWNIHFNPINNIQGNSYPTLRDLNVVLVTSTMTLDATYFGKQVIVEPDGAYIELTLPDINTVVEGRQLLLEIGGENICTVKFIAVFNFLRGNLYMMASESACVYKFVRAGVPEWRVTDANGNFRTVGSLVSHDTIQADVINMQLLDGSTKNKNQYARLYNEYVLNLPGSQVVNFNDWGTGNNNRFYSLANGTDVNVFKIPDRRGLYERNLLTGKGGDYLASMVGPHSHPYGIGIGIGGAAMPDYNPPDGNTRNATAQTDQNTGTETRPESYLINKYVLL